MLDHHDLRSPARPRAIASVSDPVGAAIRGRLLRRYKRFLADVETDAGERLTVHCPNPGSMRGMNTPGMAVRCSTSDAPHRKLRHTLEMVRSGRIWVGVHTLRANRVAARLFETRSLPAFRRHDSVQREIKVGMPVKVHFEDRPEGVTLPLWKKA